MNKVEIYKDKKLIESFEYEISQEDSYSKMELFEKVNEVIMNHHQPQEQFEIDVTNRSQSWDRVRVCEGSFEVVYDVYYEGN